MGIPTGPGVRSRPGHGRLGSRSLTFQAGSAGVIPPGSSRSVHRHPSTSARGRRSAHRTGGPRWPATPRSNEGRKVHARAPAPGAFYGRRYRADRRSAGHALVRSEDSSTFPVGYDLDRVDSTEARSLGATPSTALRPGRTSGVSTRREPCSPRPTTPLRAARSAGGRSRPRPGPAWC